MLIQDTSSNSTNLGKGSKLNKNHKVWFSIKLFWFGLVPYFDFQEGPLENNKFSKWWFGFQV